MMIHVEGMTQLNDDSRGRCDIDSQLRFKTSTLKSSLCACNGAYIFVNGTTRRWCSSKEKTKEIKK